MSEQWDRLSAELADTREGERIRRGAKGERVIQCPADGDPVVVNGLTPISRCACDDQAEAALAEIERARNEAA